MMPCVVLQRRGQFDGMMANELENECRKAGIDPEKVVVAEEPLDSYVTLTMLMQGNRTAAFGVEGDRQQFEQTNTVDGTSSLVEWKEKFEFEVPKDGEETKSQLSIRVFESDLGDPVFVGQATLSSKQLNAIAEKPDRTEQLRLELQDTRAGKSGELTVVVSANVKEPYYSRMWDELEEKHVPQNRDVVQLPATAPVPEKLLRKEIKKAMLGGTDGDKNMLYKYMQDTGLKFAVPALLCNSVLFILGVVTCILAFILPAGRLDDDGVDSKVGNIMINLGMKNGAAWGIITCIVAIIGIIGALGTGKEWKPSDTKVPAERDNDKSSPGIQKLLLFFYALLPVNLGLLCAAFILFFCKDVPKWGVERMSDVRPADYKDLFDTKSIADSQNTVSGNMTVVGVFCLVTWFWSFVCFFVTWKLASGFHVMTGLTEALNLTIVLCSACLMFATAQSLELSDFTSFSEFAQANNFDTIVASVMIAICFFICLAIVTGCLGIVSASLEKRNLLLVPMVLHSLIAIAGLVCGFGAFSWYFPEKLAQENCGLMGSVHMNWIEDFAACPKYNGKASVSEATSKKAFTAISNVCTGKNVEMVAWERPTANQVAQMGCLNYRCCGSLLGQIRDNKTAICIVMCCIALLAAVTVVVTNYFRTLLLKRPQDDDSKAGEPKREGYVPVALLSLSCPLDHQTIGAGWSDQAKLCRFKHKYSTGVLAVAVMVMLAGIIVTAAWMAGNRKFEFDKEPALPFFAYAAAAAIELPYSAGFASAKFLLQSSGHVLLPQLLCICHLAALQICA